MTTLSGHDVTRARTALPAPIKDLLKANGPKLVLAGGFLRATVAGEKPSDIDLFCDSEASAKKLADSTEELLAMADKIGVQRKWIQKAGTPQEHFDICASKRKLAVRCGAVDITMWDAGRIINKRRAVISRSTT